jgi:hypothetical protein
MMNNANGALAQLTQKLSNLHPNYPFDIAETMFMSTVIPVAAYGCEIFGPMKEIDTLLIRFFRNFFSLERKTPIDAIYCITGWVPPSISLVERQLNFLKKMAKCETTSLCHKAIIQAVELAKNRNTCMMRNAICNWKGHRIDWSRTSAQIVDDFRSLKPNLIQQQLVTEFRSELMGRLELGAQRIGRVAFLRSFCVPVSRFFFLDALPRHLATAMIQMLTSGHHFKIETGRKDGIPKQERLCDLCGILDDERHTLFDCTAFTPEREQFVYRINKTLSGAEDNLVQHTRAILATEPTRDTSKIDNIFSLANYVRCLLKSSKEAYDGSLILYPEDWLTQSVIVGL